MQSRNCHNCLSTMKTGMDAPAESTDINRSEKCCTKCQTMWNSLASTLRDYSSSLNALWIIFSDSDEHCELSLLEQMTNADVIVENTVNTVIENTVNNQRKQNKHLGIKEDLHSLFGHIGSVQLWPLGRRPRWCFHQAHFCVRFGCRSVVTHFIYLPTYLCR